MVDSGQNTCVCKRQSMVFSFGRAAFYGNHASTHCAHALTANIRLSRGKGALFCASSQLIVHAVARALARKEKRKEYNRASIRLIARLSSARRHEQSCST